MKSADAMANAMKNATRVRLPLLLHARFMQPRLSLMQAMVQVMTGRNLRCCNCYNDWGIQLQMNRRMNLPQLQAVMRNFAMETSHMDMTQEMMGDAVDDVMAGSDEVRIASPMRSVSRFVARRCARLQEEEEETVVKQVMEELKISMMDAAPEAPFGAVGTATAAAASAGPARVAAAAGGGPAAGGTGAGAASKPPPAGPAAKGPGSGAGPAGGAGAGAAGGAGGAGAGAGPAGSGTDDLAARLSSLRGPGGETKP